MTHEQCMALIRERLEVAFQPTILEVVDDSHQHIGHSGSEKGAGHFTIIITAKLLKIQSRVAAHREIYAKLADLIPQKIHALIIKIV
jgi:BolA protein